MNTTDAKALLSDAPLGEVTVADDNLQVVFHRHLRAPVAKVWAALTTPERLADWFTKAVVDLRVGGTIHLDWADFRITVSDPPRSLGLAARRPRHAGAVRSRARGRRLPVDPDTLGPQPPPRAGRGCSRRLACAPRGLAGRA
jgi:hypothetical protein